MEHEKYTQPSGALVSEVDRFEDSITVYRDGGGFILIEVANHATGHVESVSLKPLALVRILSAGVAASGVPVASLIREATRK